MMIGHNSDVGKCPALNWPIQRLATAEYHETGKDQPTIIQTSGEHADHRHYEDRPDPRGLTAHPAAAAVYPSSV